MPATLDMTAPELAAAFRAELAELRRRLHELRPGPPYRGTAAALALVETSIDMVAARGANLCDVVTGALACRIAETKKKG